MPHLTSSKNMLAEIASMLPACFVVHKFALVSKTFRQASKILAPMNAHRIIFVKLGTSGKLYDNLRFFIKALQSFLSLSNQIGFADTQKKSFVNIIQAFFDGQSVAI